MFSHLYTLIMLVNLQSFLFMQLKILKFGW